jgi:hypothetical protein
MRNRAGAAFGIPVAISRHRATEMEASLGGVGAPSWRDLLGIRGRGACRFRSTHASRDPSSQTAYRNLIGLGIVLLESDQDLSHPKETVNNIGEAEAKELLMVAAASAAHDYVETRRRTSLN